MADTDIELSVSFDTTDIKKKSADMRKTMQKAFDSQAVQDYDSKQKQLLATMGKVAKQSETVADKMKELEETKIPTKEYENLQKELDKIDKKTVDVGNAIADMEARGQGYGEKYTKLIEEMDKLDSAAENVQAQMTRMEQSGAAFTMGDTTEQYAKLEEQQMNLTNQMVVLATRAREAGMAFEDISEGAGDGLDEMTEDIQNMNEETEQATGIRAWAERWRDAFLNMVRGADEAEEELDELADDMEEVEDESQDLEKSVNRTSRSFTGFGSSIKRLALGGLQRGLSNLGQRMKLLASNLLTGGKGMQQLKTGVGTLIKSMIGAASIFALFNKLKSTIVQTMQTMAQMKDGENDVNKSLTALTNSLKQFKNQVGAAFAPILTVVTPILNTFIQKLTEVANAVAQVIAKLTGQSTFIRAKKIQEDYAKSLQKTNKALGAYDKLNVISQDNGGLSADDMFEEVPIEDKATEMVEKLKEAWKKADFSEFGKILGEKIKEGLQNFNDWLTNEVQEFVKNLGTSIATFLNGLFGVEGLADEMGKSLANLWNTAFDFFLSFLRNFDFSQLGTFLADIVNSLTQTFDWDDFSETIYRAVNGIFDTLQSFAGRWDSIGLAEKISGSINSIFDGVEWETVGSSISEMFNKLFDFMNTLVDETDWNLIGESITTTISSFFDTFSWGNVGEGISNIASGLFDFITGLFDGVEWQELPQKIVDDIKDYFTNLDFADVAGSFAEMFFTALKSLFELGLGIGECMSALFTGITDYFAENIQLVEDAGGDLVDGIFVGIIEALASIGTWIYDNIFKPIYDAFCEVFEINSPSKVFEQLGVYLIEGLLEGINSLIEDVKEIFKGIKDLIFKAWNNIKEKTKKVFTSVAKTAKTKFSDMKDKITEKAEDIRANVSSKWQSLKETTEEKFTAIAETTKEKWNAIKKKVSNVAKKVKEDPIGAFEEVRSKVEQKMTSLKNTLSKIWNGIKNVVKDPINAILGFVQTMVNGIVDAVNKIVEFLNKLNVEIPDWIPEEFGGGQTIGFNIPKLENITIPPLAQGAVIPPNKQFLAMLGDQKSGVNIETPLNTMVEAFKSAIYEMGGVNGGNNEPIVLQLNGKQIAKAVYDENAKRYKQTGKEGYAF